MENLHSEDLHCTLTNFALYSDLLDGRGLKHTKDFISKILRRVYGFRRLSWFGGGGYSVLPFLNNKFCFMKKKTFLGLISTPR